MTLCVCALAAPELFGGAFPWAVAVTAALVALTALAVGVWCARDRAPRATVPIAGWALVAAAVWTSLFALPLPMALVAKLAPAVAEAALANARLLGVAPPAYAPLSLDPGSTQLMIAQSLAIAGGFLAAWAAAMRGHRRDVLTFAGGSVALLAAVALAHLASGATAVFGADTPKFTQPRILSPLMNENHLGGLMGLGLP